MKAVIAFGANLGNPKAAISQALALINERVGRELIRSNVRETKPLLHPDNPTLVQPNYFNGAVMVQASLSPEQILEQLQSIELELGRDRTANAVRWGPRIIDLDLICVDDLVIESENLILPHPRMHERDFVLEPLAEVWPEWRHPLLGKTAEEMLPQLTSSQSAPGI